jgi:hypothetical protein
MAYVGDARFNGRHPLPDLITPFRMADMDDGQIAH